MFGCPMQSGGVSSVLLDYCAARLNTRSAVQLEEHLAGCPSCARFVEAQSRLWSELDIWDAGEISADFDRRLYASIEERQKRRFYWFWTAKAAVPFAAACATIVLAIMLSGPGKQSKAIPAAADITRVESLEPEQIDRAVEDLEMLREFSTPGVGTQTL